MAFLGIDQSLTGTGICRLSDDGSVEAAETVDVGALVDGARLVCIKQAVARLLTGVEHAAMEGYSLRSVNRPFDLGEVGGVIKALLTESRVLYVAVPPVLVKKYATGHTNAEKTDMVIAAMAHGFAPADDNQADAFHLANIARALTHDTAKLRCELEVLRTIKNGSDTKKPARRVRRLVKAAI